MGAETILIEDALVSSDVAEELDAIDSTEGPGGEAAAVSLAFFAGNVDAKTISSVEPGALLGYLTVINYKKPSATKYTLSFVYEAVLRRPHIQSPYAGPLLNNFFSVEGEFKRVIAGRDFVISGVYYCQQNGESAVCAHAALRMALNTTRAPVTTTNEWINSLLKPTNVRSGLSLPQIRDAVTASNTRTFLITCKPQTPTRLYLQSLHSFLASGYAAMLMFSIKRIGATGRTAGHVVPVYGYTHNSDEWHPEALLAYVGPVNAQYYPSSLWVDHYLIHDDNLGPYYAWNSHELEGGRGITMDEILVLTDVDIQLPPHAAEGIASSYLQSILNFSRGRKTGEWFRYITDRAHTFILRTVLMHRDAYLDHLRKAVGHDQTRCTEDQTKHLINLPDTFWMTEFSLPSLYTGNRTKLGEVLISDNEPDYIKHGSAAEKMSVLAARMPEVMLRFSAGKVISVSDLNLTSHSPYYQRSKFGPVW